MVFSLVDNMIKDLEICASILEENFKSTFLAEMEDEYFLMKNKLECLEKREDIQLAQIAKKKLLKVGDRDSKYFHAVIKQK